jgi:FkbM family methyltransferase
MIIYAIALSAIAPAVITILQVYGFSLIPQMTVPSSTFSNSNMAGLFFALCLPSTLYCLFKSLDNSFLNNIKGVIHIGASTGQERDIYQKYGLDVVWVEPIPDIFKKLRKNIKNYSRQRAFQYLITDKDGAEYKFNISTNKGMSSSIYDLKHHKDIWPDITYKQSITLKSITLPTLLIKEQI